MITKLIKEDILHITSAIEKESKKLENSTVLISGGAGFLGSYFIAVIDYLNKKQFKKPCKVISIDNFITGKKRGLFGDFDEEHITFIKSDILKPILYDRKVDYIIHAAGIASPVYYNKYPLETIEVAINGTKNLLEFAQTKKLKSFLYFSSSEIYGNPDDKNIPTPETYYGNVSSLGPRACYDESKRLGETLCMTYYRMFNTPIKIVRPFNIYGPGMYPDDYRVIPNFVSRALNGKALTVYNKGFQTRTFCYITDAVAGFLKVLLSNKNGEAFNIGNEENEITMEQLAQEVIGLLPHAKMQLRAYPKNYPTEETDRRCPDISKAKKALHYEPSVSLHEGLKRFITWYKYEFSESLK
jgi:UDP-glucuronate decarboxylase